MPHLKFTASAASGPSIGEIGTLNSQHGNLVERRTECSDELGDEAVARSSKDECPPA